MHSAGYKHTGELSAKALALVVEGASVVCHEFPRIRLGCIDLIDNGKSELAKDYY